MTLDPTRRMAVNELACGACGAVKGEDCTTAFGNRKWPPHKQRLDNAAERWREQPLARHAEPDERAAMQRLKGRI